MEQSRVAIIGAGVAGLACARALHEAGIDCAVYDKGRGPGGRCSSRRTPHGRFDHGAQFFTVRDDRFGDRVRAWASEGLVAPWRGEFVRVRGEASEPYEGDERWVGTPAFNAFVRHEAEALGAQFGLKMAPPRRAEGSCRWALQGENGASAWEADWVVVAVPAEQAAMLVPPPSQGGSARLRHEAAAARTAPTWTLMAAFEEADAAPFDAASIEGHDLAWISREASKPGREPGARWVAHASPEWSEANLEREPDAVAERLVPALRALVRSRARLVHAGAHRWRYAQVEEAAEEPFGLDEQCGLAVCGDWRIAPRVESAWVSGDALGRALAGRL